MIRIFYVVVFGAKPRQIESSLAIDQCIKVTNENMKKIPFFNQRNFKHLPNLRLLTPEERNTQDMVLPLVASDHLR